MKPLPIILAIAVLALGHARAIEYTLGPDSQEQAGVPQGKVTQHQWNTSKVFPGTTRDYWVYVPAEYVADKPACLMVFQDGGGYAKRDGAWRVPVVFDNLIHKKEMPVTVGLFINPGVVPAPNEKAQARYNRSFEYDSVGDRYARFLLEEMLPEVAKTVHLSANPDDRAIAGSSSGAICAFNVAWERPDTFRRVFSTIGTYVGLRGADVFPTLIRKTEPKPLRVFLQDGSNDLNIYGGSWWVANQDMLSALEFAGYQVNHAWGDGGHDSKHGASILPDALRWLWQDHGQPLAKPGPTKSPVWSILQPGEDWQLVSQGHRFTEGPAVNEQGEVFFTDIPNSRIHRVALDGQVSVFAENTGGANGLMFGPEGKLHACQMRSQKIVRYDASAKEEVLAEAAPCNDLVVLPHGLYFTDPGDKKVWYLPHGGQKRVVDEGIGRPNGIVASPDQTLLYVADSSGRWVYSFQIQADGALAYKQEYFHLHLPDNSGESGADGMTVDTEGRLYVTTKLGLQVCDQPGRVNAILPHPVAGKPTNVVFGGPGLDTLYLTGGEKVFRRKVKAKGFLPWKEAITPPKPRL